jgi:hypothetical protein
MPLNKDPQGGGTNTWKGGNSGGCGTLMLALVGICAFFIIKWIAPFLIAGCFVFGMR